jgi:2-keto-4-pentenoate hydratase
VTRPTRAKIRHLADVLAVAHRDGALLEPEPLLGSLDLATAYAVQTVGLHRKLSAGERLVGWKVGYTSAAMRAQMNVAAPNYGPLTDRMVLSSGEDVRPGLAQPRVEPEVLVVLGSDLPPKVSRDQVAAAVAEARAALEVVDSVWRDYRFRLEDNTADGSSAAHAVVGPAFAPGTDLASVEVVLTGADGERLESTGAAAMGDPLEAVRWLAAALGASGRRLRAGHLVLTGGLTRAVPLPEGGSVAACFQSAGEVRIGRGAR